MKWHVEFDVESDGEWYNSYGGRALPTDTPRHEVLVPIDAKITKVVEEGYYVNDAGDPRMHRAGKWHSYKGTSEGWREYAPGAGVNSFRYLGPLQEN